MCTIHQVATIITGISQASHFMYYGGSDLFHSWDDMNTKFKLTAHFPYFTHGSSKTKKQTKNGKMHLQESVSQPAMHNKDIYSRSLFHHLLLHDTEVYNNLEKFCWHLFAIKGPTLILPR